MQSQLETIIAKDLNHLKRLVKEHIQKHGVKCDLNHIDVSNINDMAHLFDGSDFNGNISKWNVSNVSNMNFMFCNSIFNGDISQWYTSNLRETIYMFNGSQFNGDISKWNVSNVSDMECMFRFSLFNKNISDWDVSNVYDMSRMFDGSIFTGNLSQWNINDDCDFTDMFKDAKYPKDGVLFWYFALDNKIKTMDTDRAAHMGMVKPILDGMGLEGIRAARYLYQTFTNTNQNIINVSDIINI